MKYLNVVVLFILIVIMWNFSEYYERKLNELKIDIIVLESGMGSYELPENG
jgi:Na+-transporting methylmalonyl-CoA/oxaloacetate decarboxylase gamma subunit